MSETDRGMAFPFRFDARTGGVQLSQDLNRIRESLQQILGIRLGERFRRPEYGSRLKDLVFEGNDPAIEALVQHWVIDAVKRWEDRVVIEKARFKREPDLGLVKAIISCRINSVEVALEIDI